MNSKIKQKIKRVICRLPFLLRLASYKTRYMPRIFMYHRFVVDGCNTGSAVSVKNFEWQLQQLQGRWNVITLVEYVRLRRENLEIPPYTVILTVDDGYRDFYDVAFPLLSKYKFSASFFVTTAFVEGTIWLWHDRLHYALEHAKTSGRKIQLGKKTIELMVSTKADKSQTWLLLSDYCIEVSDEEKWRLIRLVEETLDVDVPAIPPDAFAAVSWGQLKEMAEDGIEIGGHTITHPILSQIESSQLNNEIATPKKIIGSKIEKVIETFCYPNGRDSDITIDVLKVIKEVGYLGAVQGFGIDFSNLYRLPRFGVTNDRLDFIWKLNGFEQLLLKYHA